VATLFTCAACGSELASEDGRALPCEECGSIEHKIQVGFNARLGLGAKLNPAACASNAATDRARQLRAAIADIEAAVEVGKISDAQDATKRALEAIHELMDCLARGEWSRSGWDAGAIGLWHALIGAHNASHHTSSTVAAERYAAQRSSAVGPGPKRDRGTSIEAPAGGVQSAARREDCSPRPAKDGGPDLEGSALTPGARSAARSSRPTRSWRSFSVRP
jgi:hypothetical protein